MASKASATAMMRASTGISPPRRPGEPAPVHPLVVGAHDPQYRRRLVRDRHQHPLAQCGVLGDLAILVGSERAGLVQHGFAGADLPDVVQLAAEPDVVHHVAVEAELRGRRHPVAAHPDRVPAGVGVLRLQGARQHLHPFQKQLLDPERLLLDPLLQQLVVVPVLELEGPFFQHPDHPRLSLADRYRLDQEVGGAQVEALDRGTGLGDAAEQDDGGIGIPLAHHAEQFVAVQFGQAEIGDDERHLAEALQEIERFATVRRLVRGEAEQLERAAHGATHHRVVIDDDASRRAAVNRFRGPEVGHVPALVW
jgi:hypothetical protein